MTGATRGKWGLIIKESKESGRVNEAEEETGKGRNKGGREGKGAGETESTMKSKGSYFPLCVMNSKAASTGGPVNNRSSIV